MEEKTMNPEAEIEACELVAAEEASRERGFARVKQLVSRIGARNLVVASSLLLIGTAVVLNFVMFGNSNPMLTEGELLGEGEFVEDLSASAAKSDGYFASAQLSRQQARDQAIAVLQTVVASSADELSREQANADISRIASEIQTEASIETLIRSKGFEECVAVIGEGSASVIVRSDGLLPNELSQIKEIVWEQAGIDPVDIKIIEKQPE